MRRGSMLLKVATVSRRCLTASVGVESDSLAAPGFHRFGLRGTVFFAPSVFFVKLFSEEFFGSLLRA